MESKGVKLGDEVKDLVSGFKGIAFGITTFLNGCARIAIQPKVGKDGKMPEDKWIDEPQLVVTKKQKVVIDRPKKAETGGPMPSIPTRHTGG